MTVIILPEKGSRNYVKAPYFLQAQQGNEWQFPEVTQPEPLRPQPPGPAASIRLHTDQMSLLLTCPKGRRSHRGARNLTYAYSPHCTSGSQCRGRAESLLRTGHVSYDPTGFHPPDFPADLKMTRLHPSHHMFTRDYTWVPG